VFLDEDKDKKWDMTGNQLRNYGIKWYQK